MGGEAGVYIHSNELAALQMAVSNDLPVRSKRLWGLMVRCSITSPANMQAQDGKRADRDL
jgi:hypothetical protein